MNKMKLLTLFALLSVWMNLATANRDISLTFVFDSTASMGDDLTQVKDGTNKIINKFLAMGEKSPIKEYVLVTFNDPDVSEALVTTDVAKLKGALSSIKVNGGGDCAEMCIGGIENAAKASRNGSSIYVFTDATAKDYLSYPRVKSILQAKKLKVVFVLTGDCSVPASPGFQIYTTVANDTDGQLFMTSKTNVKEFMNSLLASIGGDDYDDYKIDPRSTKYNQTIYFYVKSYTASLSIHLTLNTVRGSIKASLLSPKGEHQSEETGLVEYFAAQYNIYSVSMRSPMSGKWVLHIYSTETVNIKINFVMNEKSKTTTIRPKPRTTKKPYRPTTSKKSGNLWWMKMGFEYKRHHSGSYRNQGSYGILATLLVVAMVNLI